MWNIETMNLPQHLGLVIAAAAIFFLTLAGLGFLQRQIFGDMTFREAAKKSLGG